MCQCVLLPDAHFHSKGSSRTFLALTPTIASDTENVIELSAFASHFHVCAYLLPRWLVSVIV